MRERHRSVATGGRRQRPLQRAGKVLGIHLLVGDQSSEERTSRAPAASALAAERRHVNWLARTGGWETEGAAEGAACTA